MLKYAEPDDYLKLLGVESIPDNLEIALIKATKYIKTQTLNRIVEINDNIKIATCLIAEKIIEKDIKLSEIGNLKSQNVEGLSESYQDPQNVEDKYKKEMKEILNMYLFAETDSNDISLLYRG